MVFAFDPRKLVEAEKKKKQEEEEEGIKKVSYDEEKAQREKDLLKNENIQEALSVADQAIKEFKYAKEHGAEAYEKIKKEQEEKLAEQIRLETEEKERLKEIELARIEAEKEKAMSEIQSRETDIE